MQMIYVSKTATKVRLKDGSYREVKGGEALPEAVNFRNPMAWAHLVSAESDIGKRALSLRKESDAKLKALGEKSPDGNENVSEQSKTNEPNEIENENSSQETETPENQEQKVEEENQEIESSETEVVDERFAGMTANDIRAEAKKRFGTKINGRLGLDKVIKAYLKLEKDFAEVEKGESE